MEGRWGLRPALKVSEIHFSTSQFTSSLVDEVSCHIIPSNLRLLYVPICSVGDGNFLFNSASWALCLNESLAVKLHLCTCFELANNRESFKRHHISVNTSVTYQGKGGLYLLDVLFLLDELYMLDVLYLLGVHNLLRYF